MRANGRSTTAIDVQSIVSSIDKIGFCVIEDYLSEENIKELQNSVRKLVDRNGNETLALTDPEDFRGTFLYDLTYDAAFLGICRSVYELAFGARAPEVSLVPSLRCLSGRTARQHSMNFHYDSFVLTAIVPIMIPSEGKQGRLVLYPNARKIRKTYFVNLLDKLLLDSRLAQRLFLRMHENGSQRLRYISMSPGNIYLFWGYRTVHTNEECDPDKIRATAIFHYVDPHAASGMKKALGR